MRSGHTPTEKMMNSHSARHAPAALLLLIADVLQVAGSGLARLARSLDARLAARKAEAASWHALAELSDRDLRDIGLNRFDVLRG
jgi:uncharacterized protein YjiS (DUF1127 family)